MKRPFFPIVVMAIVVILLPSTSLFAQTVDTDSRSVGGFAVVGALDANQGYELDQLGGMLGAILVLDEIVELSISHGKFKVSPESRMVDADSLSVKKVVISELRAGFRIPIWEIFSIPVGIGIARIREVDIQYDLIGYFGLVASVSEESWHIDLGIHNAWYPDRHGRQEGKYPPRNTMAFVGVRRDFGE